MKKFILFLGALLCLLPSFAGDKNKKSSAVKISDVGIYKGYSTPTYKGFDYTSYYIPMVDSVLLAADVFLPKNLEKGKKVPVILYLTRYVRSVKAKFPLSLLKNPILTVVHESEVEFFTSHGYACVIVDVRGTGASTGTRRMEFSPEEVADGKQIVDWLISRNWCDGNIGVTGVSYLGTTAEMLLVNQHPNVKACIPRSNIFDLYNDILYPGGVCQSPFVDVWGLTTRCLDNNNFKPLTKKWRLLQGTQPVKGDWQKQILKMALAHHKKNFDVFSGLKTVRFRDDLNSNLGAAPDSFSIHHYRQKIEGSGTPIYRIGGWYDGALARSCTDGFLNTSNTEKVLIGPWDHGPQYNVSPFAASNKVNLDILTEMLRFFDFHLKGIANGIDAEPAITYYSVGKEKWERTNTWPPKEAEPTRLFLSAANTLEANASTQNSSLNYTVDYSATSGKTSRWNSVTTLYMNGPTHYADRRMEDAKLISFNSAPLSSATEITGHAVVHVNFSADADDATLFCYLEDVGPDSSVTYVTEGMLRPAFRKVTDDGVYKTAYPDHSFKQADNQPYVKGETVELEFDLLPISYLFAQGHSIRISFAGADNGHFDLPQQKPQTFTFTFNPQAPAYIQLPVMK
ncbi:MAG: CocE/NonD family hydrolase [Chitinophagales bacterium]